MVVMVIIVSVAGIVVAGRVIVAHLVFVGAALVWARHLLGDVRSVIVLAPA